MVGETLMVFVIGPVFHEYEVAPEAVSMVGVPEHKLALLTTTVGLVVTFTVAVFTFVQFPFEPVKVYEVVVVGLTAITEAVGPVFHE